MSSSFSTGTFTFDPKSRTLDGNRHGRDENGAETTWRQTDVRKDDDHRDWTMYRKGADGKEAVELRSASVTGATTNPAAQPA